MHARSKLKNQTNQASPLQTHFRDYARYHRHPVCNLTHAIGIPLILLAGIAGLDRLPHALGPILWIPLAVAYVLKGGRNGACVAMLLALAFPIARWIPDWFAVSCFIAGWILQLAGHLIWERRQPAFVKNPAQLFIAPLYYLQKVRLPAPRSSTAPLTRAIQKTSTAFHCLLMLLV